jgi:hypothetical protein
VPFCDTTQLAQQRKLVVRTPRAHAQSATLHQGAMHLASCQRAILEELKPLLAEDDVKLLLIAKRKGTGIPFPPIDCGGQPACHGKHLGIKIDPDDLSCGTEPFLGQSGNNAGSASDIKEAVAWPKPNVCKQGLDPRLEERAY